MHPILFNFPPIQPALCSWQVCLIMLEH
ncbi:Bgt-50178 [Blumeria graminis f. sp. tritici]|uniref:Bgt-50178 n=1 Tax=Blumeria graminis f. sp. tritici TaxID=62690 RepID=A0A9X9MJX5_BLUGR|nr:Bgt-50178 [Blumeria graminis f. sp. tritici]